MKTLKESILDVMLNRLDEAGSDKLNALRKKYNGTFLSNHDIEEFPKSFVKTSSDFAKKHKLKNTEIGIVDDQINSESEYQKFISILKKEKIPYTTWNGDGENHIFFSLKDGVAEEVDEAVKVNDPANLRSIITNHTKLLSKAADSKAKEFHRVAIANAKEKLKSLGEEIEEDTLDESFISAFKYDTIANLPSGQLESFFVYLADSFMDKFDDDAERTDCRDFGKELMKLSKLARKVN